MSIIRNIKKSTFALKKHQTISHTQQKLNFLIRMVEQNIGLQKIQFQSNFLFNNSIFKKGNPFFFVRKNYKKLFWNFLQKGFISPNLLKFLHIAYWPTNSDQAWRMYYNYHGLERKQRINFVQPTFSKLSYFFSLIFKKSYIKNLIDFKGFSNSNSKNKYFNKLKYYYHININKLKFQHQLNMKAFSRKKKKTYIITNILNKFKYFKTPRFILKDRSKQEFKNFFFLTFRQRSFLKNLITFYFPVISLVINENNIHSLPMKTKKPRRV
uniref:hypothetical protein n=1 Tax=Thecamoeba quadrilineata TaxID=343530 RepID=UPI00226C95EE|nr:hypothetical protein OYV93_mgp06 [Thecamoeba quadrilineata]UZN43822.1 hypothetical protein [Thecamoeba quadrilineata]